MRRPSHPWYNRACWHKGYRVAALQQDPICVECGRAPSTVVDHKIPFIQNGLADWHLFSDPKNHAAKCAPCHNRKTAIYDGGFGRAKKAFDPNPVVPTGDQGRQFAASSVGSAALDRALGSPEELKALVESI